MSFHNSLRDFRSALASGPSLHKHKQRRSLQAATRQLDFEALEGRCLLSFSPAINYPAGTFPETVATADFNHDGKLDLVTANAGDQNVSVLLGSGNGTFQPARKSDTGYAPDSLAVGDFNKDGKLDVATGESGFFDSSGLQAAGVSVLLGNGDGTFQTPSEILLTPSDTPSSPTSVTVGDFNGDGRLDLGVTSNAYFQGPPDEFGGYYSDFYEGYANLLMGNGDGSFSAPNSTDLGSGYYGSSVATNANGDALDDLVVFGSNTKVLLGDSNGYFQDSALIYTGRSPWQAAGDVNGDGRTDQVTADSSGNGISVMLGNSSGGFDSALHYATDAKPVAVLLGDFNGDGWLDAATANHDANNVSVLINDRSWIAGNAASVSIKDATVTEGNTGSVNASFTVNLSAASATPITVHFTTANGSAAAGSDYTGLSGDLIFAAGQTSKTITVPVLGDRLPEPTESFLVNLTTSDAIIADGQGVGTIFDNEPRISINNVTQQEGNSGSTLMVFTVSLSAAYDQPVTVNYSTADGTAKVADNDYKAQSGKLTFAPGQTMLSISIVVYGDKKQEGDETFLLKLSGPSNNALLLNTQGVGTILDDDVKSTLSRALLTPPRPAKAPLALGGAAFGKEHHE